MATTPRKPPTAGWSSTAAPTRCSIPAACASAPRKSTARWKKVEEVLESIAIGQDWQGDVRVLLFVRLRDGVRLDEPLRERIRQTIRANATPRHVPAKIIQVADIPRTLSGKIVELAVRNVIHGRPVKNTDALANPQALELYRDLAELRD